MAWTDATNSRRSMLRLVILGILGLLVMAMSFGVSAKMSSLDNKEMREISGKEGILIDISLRGRTDVAEYVDQDGAANVAGNAGFGKLRFGGGSSNKVTIDDGAGNPASLTGMTIDADGSGNLVLGLPQGQFTIDIPWTSVVDGATAPGAGNSFGEFLISDLSVGNTVLERSAKGEGVSMDITLRMEANKIDYRDPDGSSLDPSPGNLTINNFDLGDIQDNNDPTLNGLEIDYDQTGGLVFTFPSSSLLELGFQDILAAGSSMGQFQIDDMNWDGSNLQLQPRGEGVDGQFNFQYTADSVKFVDNDGFSGGSAGNIFELNDLEIGSSPWTGLGNSTLNFKIDADDNRGVVFRTDDVDQTFDMSAGNFVLGSGSAGNFRIEDLDIGHNQFEIQPRNTGIELDMLLSLSIDSEMRIQDSDGTTGNGSAIFSLGRTTNGVRLHDDGGGEQIDIDDVTLDVDPTNGLVLKGPDGSSEFTFQIKNVSVGNSGGPFNSYGSLRVKEIDIANTRLEISGKGEGVDVDGAADVLADEVRITDSSGAEDPDFSQLSGTVQLCDNTFECISFDDGSGGQVPFDNLQVDGDGGDGVVIQAPDIPSYEFRAGNVTLSPSQGTAVPIEPLIVRDLNPQGSFLKIEPH